MPLAPGRFSTMICWPRRSVIFGPARRVMMSMVLPGGKGMTILIGLAGYDCASAAEANPSANAASTNTRACLILALLIRSLAQPGLLWAKAEDESLQIPNICAIVQE